MRYIVGTETGVGKTLLTSLLVLHLKQQGLAVRAIKPFCSGGSADARQLRAVQSEKAFTLSQISPFRYRLPLAPQAAADPRKPPVSAAQVYRFISEARKGTEWLLVEGCGGLMSPVANGLTSLDWIRSLPGEVIVVGWNRLGILNQVLLTQIALSSVGVHSGKIVLMEEQTEDLSGRSNVRILREWMPGWNVSTLAFMGETHSNVRGLRQLSKKFEKTLANVCGFDSFSPLFEGRPAEENALKKKFRTGVDNASQ